MKYPIKPFTQQKTYSHLMGNRRVPSDYEIVTSQLLYYPKQGFEVKVPIQDWYNRYQKQSPIQCKDWERFRDPRESTYTTYTALQSRQENFIQTIFESIERQNYDQKLDGDWLQSLERFVFPLRYLWHGFQMMAAYVGQLAPSGRITIASMFQCADETRRIQRVSYRMKQLQISRQIGFAGPSKAVWQKDAIWQPCRQIIEKGLITYDWAEAFVALNLCIKPAADQLFSYYFAKIAQSRGDSLLAEVFHSFYKDCEWQRSWSSVLAKMMVDEEGANREQILKWANEWQSRALEGYRLLEAEFNLQFASNEISLEEYFKILNSKWLN